MSDDAIIDTIAEWLQANTRYGCSSDRLAQDFLAALRAAGYAVVKLPKPDEGWFDLWLGGWNGRCNAFSIHAATAGP